MQITESQNRKRPHVDSAPCKHIHCVSSFIIASPTFGPQKDPNRQISPHISSSGDHLPHSHFHSTSLLRYPPSPRPPHDILYLHTGSTLNPKLLNPKPLQITHLTTYQTTPVHFCKSNLSWDAYMLPRHNNQIIPQMAPPIAAQPALPSSKPRFNTLPIHLHPSPSCTLTPLPQTPPPVHRPPTCVLADDPLTL